VELVASDEVMLWLIFGWSNVCSLNGIDGAYFGRTAPCSRPNSVRRTVRAPRADCPPVTGISGRGSFLDSYLFTWDIILMDILM
jgi:hypothetical protein